jgi:hypothetical protein
MIRKIYDYLFHQNHPLAWAGTIVVLFIIAMSANYFWFDAGNIQGTFIIACTGIFLYSIYSAVMLLVAKSMAKAWNPTLIGFILVAAALTLYGMWITGQSWKQIDFYTRILKVMTFVTLVFMAIAVSIRNVVEYTQREDR